MSEQPYPYPAEPDRIDSSLSADIGGVRNEVGSMRTDVAELQRALPALELRLGDQINSLERTLAERIHSLELAFTRAGIELGPPREQNTPGPDRGGTPDQQGMLEPLAPGDAQIRSAP